MAFAHQGVCWPKYYLAGKKSTHLATWLSNFINWRKAMTPLHVFHLFSCYVAEMKILFHPPQVTQSFYDSLRWWMSVARSDFAICNNAMLRSKGQRGIYTDGCRRVEFSIIDLTRGVLTHAPFDFKVSESRKFITLSFDVFLFISYRFGALLCNGIYTFFAEHVPSPDLHSTAPNFASLI